MPRQIILASRPSGWPTADNFALAEADRPDLADGQVRVRNLFMSVDPYMRGRMNDVKSYVPPFRLGEPLEGGAIGTVIESRSPDLAEGDVVLHMLGWRDEAVLPARHARKMTPAEGLSPSAYLGVLGMPTLTAYVGVLDIAALKPGETVFVSGAAGAVGSMARTGCPAWSPTSAAGCGRARSPTPRPSSTGSTGLPAPSSTCSAEPTPARCSYASDACSRGVMIRFDHNSHFRRVLRLTSQQPGSTSIPRAARTTGHLWGVSAGRYIWPQICHQLRRRSSARSAAAPCR